MTKIDLHIHSNYSDGSDSVESIASKIANAGIKIFSLTDHDTIEGCNEIIKYIPDNIQFIRGVELTCKTKECKCHILGYNYNPNDKSLNELIAQGKKLRKIKLETRIKFLKDVWNITLTDTELSWLYSRKSVVKTHIANILVNRGLADNNIEAMKKYLDNCKTGNTRFDGEEAIDIILKSGGIPIWAHPLGGEGEKHLEPDVFYQKLKIMKECGILGLECYYSRYSMDECNFLVECATKNGLLISGGSDYHGKNKDNIAFAQLNQTNQEIFEKQITLLTNVLK